jgi:hypothetical protein
MNKNPVSLLNELRGSLDYACVSSWGSGTHQLFTMGVTIDGVSYTGTASNKKVGTLNQGCGSALASMRIRIHLFYLDADPDPGSQTNAYPEPDPGQILKSQKV